MSALLIAEIRPVAEVLEVMDRFDSESFASSTLWNRAAAQVLQEEELIGILWFAADRPDGEPEPVGAMLAEQDTAGWRSGSPGQDRLTWPFAEFGYHFAPRFARDLASASRAEWLHALHAVLQKHRLEFRRCALQATSAPTTDHVVLGEGQPTFSTKVQGGFEGWRATLRGGHRRDFEYYRRRIQKAGGVFHTCRADEDKQQALADCFGLHAERVAYKEQSSAYLTERGRHFLRALVELAPGEALITRLSLDDRVIGSVLSFLHDGQYLCFMPGWDPRHRGLDLGRQMIYEQIRNAEANGARLHRIDLLGGDLPYKREFATTAQPTVDLVACPSRRAALREGLVGSALGLYRRLVRS